MCNPSLGNNLRRRPHVVAVGEQVVHRRHPLLPGITDPFHLDRRRLAGERQQPIAGQVSAEIEKDIDAIAANPLGQRFVRQFSRVQPMVGRRDESISYRVSPRRVGVAEELASAVPSPSGRGPG